MTESTYASLEVKRDHKNNLTSFSLEMHSYDNSGKRIRGSTQVTSYTFDQDKGEFFVVHWDEKNNQETTYSLSKEKGLSALGNIIASQPNLKYFEQETKDDKGNLMNFRQMWGKNYDNNSPTEPLTYKNRKEALGIIGLVGSEEFRALEKIEAKVFAGELLDNAKTDALIILSQFGVQTDKVMGIK